MASKDLRDLLQSIYDQHGQLTPNLVVDVARDPEHPLHSRFEWDDAAAGDAWRRQQAHELIRSVRVIYKKSDESTGSVRAYHAVRVETGHVYEPVERVVADSMLTKIVMADMEREWRQLKARYEAFNEFWELVRQDLDEAA